MILCYIPLILVSVILGIKNKNIKWYSFVLVIISGMIAVVPTVLIQMLIPSFNESTKTLLDVLLSSLIIASIEELCKSLSLFCISVKKHSIKEFFILSIISGLSFGSFELIVYLLTGTMNIGVRIITAVVLHAICTGTASFFIWFIRQKKVHITFILTPIFLHAIYNFFASLPGKFWWFSIIVVLYGIFQCNVFYQMFIKNQKE